MKTAAMACVNQHKRIKLSRFPNLRGLTSLHLPPTYFSFCIHCFRLSLSLVYTYDFHSLVVVLVLALLHRMCKPGQRKHKHNCKERKLKNSDKLSAYILQVTHALPFSAMLESNLLPKGSLAMRLRQNFILQHLHMSPYANVYRMCKHPCAYTCIVRVNQALVKG